MNSCKNYNSLVKILKSFLCVFLSLVMVLSMSLVCPKKAFADPKEITVSVSNEGLHGKTKQAVDTTDDVVASSGIDNVGGFLQGMANFSSSVYYVLSAANIVMDWLGYGSSSSTQSLCMQMYRELTAIHEELDMLNTKINNITNNLSKFWADTKFDSRLDKASEYKNRWNSFEEKYLQNGLDNLLDEYNWKLRSGFEKWATDKNGNSRNANGIDNESIYILYNTDYVTGKETILYSKDNYNDADLLKNADRVQDERNRDRMSGRDPQEVLEREKTDPYFTYIRIPKELVPKAYSDWDINTYKDRFKSGLATNIVEDLKNPAYLQKFNDSNSYVLDYQEWPNFSDEKKQQVLDKVTEDAFSVLTYRIGAIEINSDGGTFARNVISGFNNYCTNLTGKTEQGLDALLQSIYLINSFEGEAKDDINSYCGLMALKTAQYATFAIDVIDKSNMTIKDESDESSDLMKVANNWVKSISVIDAAHKNGIKGYDDFCYVTNSRISVLPVDMYMRFSYKTDSSGNKNNGGYRMEISEVTPQISYILDGVSHYDDEKGWWQETLIPQYIGKYEKDIYSNMIAQQPCMLIDLYYLSKGQGEGFTSYLKKYCKCADGSNTDLSKIEGSLMTSCSNAPQDVLSVDNDLTMHETWYHYGSNGWPEVSGNRNEKWGNINNSSYNFNKKMTAEFLDVNTGEPKTDQTVVAYCKSNKNDNSNFLRMATYGRSCYEKLNFPEKGRNTCIGLGTRNYVLVKEDIPSNNLLKANNLSYRTSTLTSYNPFDSLNETQESINKTGTTFGSGDVVLVCVLCALAASAITCTICYAVFKRKNSRKKK